MKLRLSLVVLSCVLSIVIGLVLARRGSGDAKAVTRARPLIGLSMDTLKEERWQGDRDMFSSSARGARCRRQVDLRANSDDSSPDRRRGGA